MHRQPTRRTRWGLACLTAVLLLLSTGPTKARTTIGPDASLYVATDALPYAFVDIAHTGTRVLAGSIDERFVRAPLGFSFDFYGTSWSDVFVNPNGLLTFGGTGPFPWLWTADNRPLTGPVPPALPLIAVLWDDWIFVPPTATDAVYYQTRGTPGSRQFVVQWERARGPGTIPVPGPFPIFVSPSSITFQAILFEGSNDIRFNYEDVITGTARDNGASATVGIRDVSGHLTGNTLQWSHNQPVIRDGQSIRFAAIPEPGTCALLAAALLPLAGAVLRRRKA